MSIPTQDFTSSVSTSTAGATSSNNGQFGSQLSAALDNMDTDKMVKIVTLECSNVVSRRVDEFLVFLRKLGTGNSTIFRGIMQNPSVIEKLTTLKSEVEHFSREGRGE